jgi:hypothetical protein
MEPLTAGAIALVTLLLDKTWEKAGEKVVDTAFQRAVNLLNLLRKKSPETGGAIAKVVENPAVREQQPADYGEAVLVEKVTAVANANAEIKQQLEALAEAIQSQPKFAQVIENWQGINIKGGTVTIEKPTFTF